MAKERTNIYTIAKEAGVSTSTVSRVLTNNARVSQEKRERVEAAIRKYGYRPNALAQGLSTAKTHTIGALLADISAPFYANVAKACERAADNHGYMLLMQSSLSDSELERRQLLKLYEQSVDAIIIIGGQVDHMSGSSEFIEMINQFSNTIPIVATGLQTGADNYRISLDESGSMEQAMNYLLSLGHRKIAFLGGWIQYTSTFEKTMRYRNMLFQNGIEYREDFVIGSKGYDDVSGYESMNRLMQLPDGPTAVITINDYTAAGVLRAIYEAGKRVPEDYSVISFDNTYMAKALTPGVTSVGCNYDQFGETLVSTAIRLVEGEDVVQTQIVPVEMSVRGSCAKLEN